MSHPIALLVLMFYYKPVQSLPEKPLCQSMEICRIPEYSKHGFCRCPGPSGRCPMNPSYALVYKDVTFNFCAPLKFRFCKLGEIAWENQGFRSIFHCYCSFSIQGASNETWNRTERRALYKCVLPKICRTNGICKLKNVFHHPYYTSFTESCKCPDNYECTETGENVYEKPFDLSRHIWRCSYATHNDEK